MKGTSLERRPFQLLPFQKCLSVTKASPSLHLPFAVHLKVGLDLKTSVFAQSFGVASCCQSIGDPLWSQFILETCMLLCTVLHNAVSCGYSGKRKGVECLVSRPRPEDRCGADHGEAAPARLSMLRLQSSA